MKNLQKLSVLTLAAAALTACSPFSGNTGVDYKSAQRGNPLEVPPDLTRISNDGRYNIPGSASATAYDAQREAGQKSGATALQNVGDVQIKREGNQRWLVVARTPQQLWDPVKTFWENNGFVLAMEDRRVGVMETDWAENRAKIPLDPIRRTIGKALDSLYSTGELDRYRTRLETNAAGGTNIYVSHRGMEEVLRGREKEQSTWAPRASDPALEDEMLRRLMMSLGVSKERADAMLSQDSASKGAQASNIAYSTNTGALQLNEDFDRAWRRVGLSLDRTGFTVEDRDRAAGTYYVRYVPYEAVKQEPPGFLGRLFGKKTPEAKPVRYRVVVQSQGATSVVGVLTESGQQANPTDRDRILKVLAEDLKRL